MEAMTHGEMNDVLVKFSTESARYRQALLDEPKRVVATQFGTEIPEHVDIKVLQETPTEYYFVLPHHVEAGAELSDADLEQVAGGGTFVLNAKCSGGMLCTVVNVEAKLFG